MPTKIVVLCRTDIFDRLPDPNANKIRQDAAVVLDWYQHVRSPEQSGLVALANLKAGVSAGQAVDVLRSYFPAQVSSRSTYNYLADLTRHTPRDFLRLLHHIKGFAGRSGVLSFNQIRDGVRSYSVNYFLPEIRNELVGHLSASEIEEGLYLLTRLKRKSISRKLAIENLYAGTEFDDSALERFLRVMFECSAVGSVERRNNRDFYEFKYRNRQASLAGSDRIRLHPGLHLALNLTN